MKCRCANIITMMCLTLVLIGFACDVATATEAVVGDGTPGSCIQEALQIAVNGGGTVTFDCGATATINVVEPILIGINSTVTIDGGGNRIIIDGKNSTRLFEVLSGALNLTGLTLVMESPVVMAGPSGVLANNLLSKIVPLPITMQPEMAEPSGLATRRLPTAQ